MLDIREISKTFNAGTINEKVALNGLSLHMNEGDFVTVIGSNGAGKSTLLNAIAGTWPVDKGSITIGGSFGGWDAANDIVMTPVYNNENNHVWCATMTVGAGNKEEFKFKGNGGWDTNWGFGAGDGTVYLVGKGVQNGGNLALEEGTWIIMFNDITGEFSIIAAN